MTNDTPLTPEEYHRVREALAALTAEWLAKLPEESDRQRAQELMDFRNSIITESDRGSALMAAAFLDDKLGDLIQRRLVADAKAVKAMLDPAGPLGAFSARIEFCYLMGILPANARADLHLIRKIRNDFAHVAGPIGFEDASVKGHCDDLTFHGVRASAPVGAKFRRSVMGVLSLLVYELNDVTHIPVMVDFIRPDGKEIYDLVAQVFEAQTGKPSPTRDHYYE